MDARALMAGLGTGALLMYLMDPDRGRRRRAYIRDKSVRLMNVKRDALGKAIEDTKNRATGLWCETKSRFSHEDVSDEAVTERVRAKMGRVTTHPRAITVSTMDGEVTLRGPILANEIERLTAAVRKVKGVRRVNNEMSVHSSAEGVPALQGGSIPQDRHLDLFSDHWKPSTALMMGVVGGALALYGMSRESRLGHTLGAVGLGMVTKSFTDMEGHRVFAKESQNNGLAA